MKSYSFDKEIDGNFYSIWSEIQKLKPYFIKYCGWEAEEAMDRTFFHSLKNFNECKGDIKSYIKALAKTIIRGKNREFSVDFTENVTDDVNEQIKYASLQAKIMVEDFSTSVIDEIYYSIDRTDEIIDLALSYMTSFLKLCKAIKTKDFTQTYYSKSFVKCFREISEKCTDVIPICLRIYDEYGDSMEKFLSLGDDNVGKWREVDYTNIRSRTSKRVLLVDENGEPVEHADLEPFYVKGSINGKKIVRVKFSEQMDMLLDLIDSPITNELKFVIGDRYIIITPGGSVSVTNALLYNMYSLIQNEILTNLIRDTKNSVLLNVGLEYMYFLCNDTYDLTIPERVIRGIPLKFTAEEV